MSQDRKIDDILRRLPSGDVVVDDGFAKQAILEVMRGCVPEEMKRWDKLQQIGYNLCREHMLRRIEEVGK